MSSNMYRMGYGDSTPNTLPTTNSMTGLWWIVLIECSIGSPVPSAEVYISGKISLGGLRCIIGTELSDVLTSFRKSISRGADRKI